MTGHTRKSGDTFSVRFGDTFVDFEIQEVVSDKKMVWRVVDSNLHWITDNKEWNGTRIEWEVSSRNKRTKVHMMHVGLVPGIQCYDNCTQGWNFYVGKSLLKLLTEIKRLPDGRH